MPALLNGSRWKTTIIASYSGEKQAIGSKETICCWAGDDGEDVAELEDALNSSSAGIVVIQFDHHMFTWLALATLVGQQKMRLRQVFVIFQHGVDLLAAAGETGKLSLQSALKSCDGIFVHSMDDVKNLEAHRVRRNVHFLPTPGSRRPHIGPATNDGAELQASYFQQTLEFATARGRA